MKKREERVGAKRGGVEKRERGGAKGEREQDGVIFPFIPLIAFIYCHRI